MNILFISSEAAPFAKSGGLGDVIGSLPKALKKHGVQARIMLPLYKSIRHKYQHDLKFITDLTVMLSWRTQYCGIFEMEYDGLTFYFLDNEQYYDRDSYYGYFDDGERFAFLSKATLDAMPFIDFKPDILHCSEWQTALVPVYLKTLYRNKIGYEDFRTIFTIHNIEYQGKFENGILTDLLGINEKDRGLLEYDNCINYMKGAIVSCDRLTTVSPSYAKEITYPFYGKGLENIIRENQYKLSGILNGIDTDLYNPSEDVCIHSNYSKDSFSKKSENKTDLQEKLGLDKSEKTPILAMVGRLAEHKGIELIIRVFDELINDNIQFILLGTGEAAYENFFVEKSREYAGRMAVVTGFSQELASSIYAGADLFLMPSISEPCGLSQMIALRYGTIPIVRETGGLKDSIKAFNPVEGTGNGITFSTVNSQDMLGAVKRALALYGDKENWVKLVNNAFDSDFSWDQSALEYINLYKEII